MNMNVIPSTGMSVSEVGLGCEHLQGMDGESIKQVVDAALACGINIFDVFMSEPQVRTNIGKALAGRRDQVILQGHIGAAWIDGQYARIRDAAQCQTFFEDFLERYQTDWLDIGFLHFIDDDTDFDAVFGGEMINYVVDLKKRGKIKAIGISSHNPAVALRAVKTGLIDVLMFSLNPAFDILPPNDDINVLFQADTFKQNTWQNLDPVRDELYRTCAASGVAITVMKGLGAGMLLNEKSSPLGVALTPVQCIHYALTRPAVASVLVGCRTPEEVYAAAAYEQASEEEKDYSIALSRSSRYTASGRCMYCNHCLPCPSMIDIAQVNKMLDLALISDSLPDTVMTHYKALEQRASTCIECASCEARCPFGVPVIDRMHQAVSVFGD